MRKSAQLARLLGKDYSTTHIQTTDLIQLYQSQLTIGHLKADEHQTRAIYQLQPIHQALKEYTPHPRLLGLFDQALLSPSTASTASQANEPSLSSSRDGYSSTALIEIINKTQHTADRDAPPGFLLTGPPGTGKTLLMDLFFDSLPIHQKFRRHYHHFLLSLYSLVSKRLEQSRLSVEDASEILSLKHQPSGYLPPKQDRARNKALSQGWRSIFAGGKDPRDPTLNGPNFVLAQVARDLILNQGWVLAFDEIQMVDVAGAGILSRVLEWYWRLGGVVIGTSNRLPEHMYDQGVQKSTVAPFLDRLKIKSPVVSLDSDVDWRLSLSLESAEENNASHWYQNIDSGLWKNLVDSHLPSPCKTDLVVYGRTIMVNRSDPPSKSAVFTYQELCETALGPADYLKICSSFQTIMLEGVPVFTTLMKNEARRLITFIDAAYECSIKLYVNSSTSIDKLFFPDAQDQRNQANAIELETLADVVEELSEPFRPNVSSYQEISGGEETSSRKPQKSNNRIETTSIEQLAIFSGQDEKYAFDRATSRLFELTKSGGRSSKAWTPLELDLTSNPTLPASAKNPHDLNQKQPYRDGTSPLTVSRQTDAHDPKDDGHEPFLSRPKISEVHFWGIMQWGKRAGRWGQGVEIFNTNKKKPKS
ncbi:hypothetical protein PtA15_8A776 [Puccinia triticina]|uniref:AAA+ ATPase domain-containing protein n=1 Tax=Puccinia triticina TaxID=208348 RepID=A0ABY7CRH2_9BASI|nr:uncharacterized protein PtA15_8A776 [Puccinia triticina]WAQ87869.1 hypothetical protein PtA15_8A776 [Puccinia triticina]